MRGRQARKSEPQVDLIVLKKSLSGEEEGGRGRESDTFSDLNKSGKIYIIWQGYIINVRD